MASLAISTAISARVGTDTAMGMEAKRIGALTFGRGADMGNFSFESPMNAVMHRLRQAAFRVPDEISRRQRVRQTSPLPRVPSGPVPEQTGRFARRKRSECDQFAGRDCLRTHRGIRLHNLRKP